MGVKFRRIEHLLETTGSRDDIEEQDDEDLDEDIEAMQADGWDWDREFGD